MCCYFSFGSGEAADLCFGSEDDVTAVLRTQYVEIGFSGYIALHCPLQFPLALLCSVSILKLRGYVQNYVA